MRERIEEKQLAILRILAESKSPLSSARLTEIFAGMGIEMSERTVRLYLIELDRRGLTAYVKKHGRVITKKGTAELEKSRVFEKVGFITAKIDLLTYRMNYDPVRKKGTVVVNISFVEEKHMKKAAGMLVTAFESGFSMGNLVGVYLPGEHVGAEVIPPGFVGIGTVCSVTLHGVIGSSGIPVRAVFGGLLEIENRNPLRFTQIVRYDGTSIDPLEIFIKSKMTRYRDVVHTGNGSIGANFLEVPADALKDVVEIGKIMERDGLGTFLSLGWPGHSLLQIPINWGRLGGVITGGLNPVAYLEESGISVVSRAISGLVEYDSLVEFHNLEKMFS